MADLNNVSFTGHLTRDAERKQLPTGTTLVHFGLANNTGWGDYKKTLFMDCNIWGKQGETLLQYLKKGKAVAVAGTLELQEWTSQADGQKKQKLVVSCKECLLMSNATVGDDVKSFKVDPESGIAEEDVTF